MLANKRKPLLILFDLKLPKVDGFALLKRIRATPSVATMLVNHCSGLMVEADRVHASELGANNYIVKHMEVREFSRMLCVALLPHSPLLDAEAGGLPFQRRKYD